MDINDVLKHKAIINEFYIDRRAAGVVDSFLMKLTVDGKVYSIHFNEFMPFFIGEKFMIMFERNLCQPNLTRSSSVKRTVIIKNL